MTCSGHIVMLFINVVTNLTFKIITALFSKALDGVNVKEMISNISSGAGAAPAAAAAPAAQAAAPADDKKGNIGTQNQERNQMDRKGRGIKLKEIGRILVWVQIGEKILDGRENRSRKKSDGCKRDLLGKKVTTGGEGMSSQTGNIYTICFWEGKGANSTI